MKREYLVMLVDALVTGSLCLVLVCGLLISSLTIVCIPAGGNPQIELVWWDPCRHASLDTPAGKPDPGMTSRVDSADPCLDLPLNRPGFEQGFNLPVPKCSADQLYAVPAIARLPLPEALERFKLAREPVPVSAAAGCLTSSLRI